MVMNRRGTSGADEPVVDRQLVERLLAAPAEPADDAPQGLSAVLSAAASFDSPGDGPLPGELEALAAFRVAQAAVPTRTPWRNRMIGKFALGKLAAAAVAGTLGLATAGGVAAAATGSLPASAQNGVANFVAHVGISLPKAEDSTQQTDTPDSTGASSDAKPTDNHGADVSKAATSHDGETEPGDHGKIVSSVASDGKSKAGEDHGKSGDHPAGSTDQTKPETEPQPESQPNDHATSGPDRSTEAKDQSKPDTTQSSGDSTSSDGTGSHGSTDQ